MESLFHNSTLAKSRPISRGASYERLSVARASSQLLLDERGEAAVRDALKLNERIFGFAQEDRCTGLALRNIEAFDAVLDDERLPEKFKPVRLPQMRGLIQTLRARQRERRPS